MSSARNSSDHQTTVPPQNSSHDNKKALLSQIQSPTPSPSGLGYITPVEQLVSKSLIAIPPALIRKERNLAETPSSSSPVPSPVKTPFTSSPAPSPAETPSKSPSPVQTPFSTSPTPSPAKTLFSWSPAPSPAKTLFISSPAPNPGRGPYKTNNVGLIAGVVCGGVVLIIMILIVLYILTRKRFLGKGDNTKSEAEKHANIKEYFKTHDLQSPREYRYREVKRMTNSFTEKIGQGGFGSVYKGTLPDGKLVAVKVLNDSKSDVDDFVNEVSIISKTSHINIVTLLGFCYNPKRVLIYEYMPNGSLDKFIYNQGSSIPTNGQLGWKMLYEIAIGIARGLEYLHRGCNTRILHFDIKPHNILLDEKFCAKISDFGLAKLGKTNQSHVSTLLGPRGTPGYIAPEVCSNHFGRVSYKSDVYSYGMMILEMVGQRRNVDTNVSQASRIYFPHYVFKRLEAGQDIHLDHEIGNEEEGEIATKMVLVSLWCIQTKPSDRPSMTAVLEMFECKSESLPSPPNPFVASPTASP